MVLAQSMLPFYCEIKSDVILAMNIDSGIKSYE